MSSSLSILNHIQIASSCPMSWEAMNGDARVRHCGQCDKHVYNLSEMTSEEAEQLIMEKEGNLCVRLFRRYDGTVMTVDCPVGLRRKIKNKLIFMAAAFLATVTFIAGAIAGINSHRRGKTLEDQLSSIRQYQPFKIVYEKLFPKPDYFEVGEMCLPVQNPPNPTPNVGVANPNP